MPRPSSASQFVVNNSGVTGDQVMIGRDMARDIFAQAQAQSLIRRPTPEEANVSIYPTPATVTPPPSVPAVSQMHVTQNLGPVSAFSAAQTVTPPSSGIPWWGWAIAAGAALFIFKKGGR